MYYRCSYPHMILSPFIAVFMENDIQLALGSGDMFYLGFTLKGGCVVEVHVCREDQCVSICADSLSNIESSVPCQQHGHLLHGKT